MTESDKLKEVDKVIKRVTYAPYICTVPRRGMQEATCYPDAIILNVDGKRIGYSAKDKTMILLPGIRGSDMNTVKIALANYLLQKKKREQK